ncbi:hypothetical protein DFJ74DRAFT_640301 [Hyaloraphidium curvatum]|nr:hypothetical protein DFJ74DRAFT_640301 [Hyaloraphidium curvatum]
MDHVFAGAEKAPDGAIYARGTDPDAAAAALVELTGSLGSVPPGARVDDYFGPAGPVPAWKRALRLALRPRRRQLARALRATAMLWGVLLVGLYGGLRIPLSVLSLFAIYMLVAGSPFRVLLTAVACVVIGVVGGCLNLAGIGWVALYNSHGGTDDYARAAIIEAWIVVVVWAFSALEFSLAGTPAAAAANLGVVFMPLLVKLGLDAVRLPSVPAADLFSVLLPPLGICLALTVASAIFVFPENPVEAARESAVLAVRSLRAVFAGEGIGNPPVRAFVLARMRNDLAALDADAKACASDVGRYVDDPSRMAALDRALGKLAQYARVPSRDPAIVHTLNGVLAALAVPRSPWMPSRWMYPIDVPETDREKGGGPPPFEQLRGEMATDRAAILARDPGEELDDEELDAFAGYLAIGEAEKVMAAAEELVAARAAGPGWYFFGRRLGGGASKPGRQEAAAAPPAARTTTGSLLPPRKWSFGKYFVDGLYALQQFMHSDAAHFGFKRAFAFFICSVWAFLPSTAEFFREENLYWLMFSVIILVTPYVGSGTLLSAVRLAVTGLAVLFAYFASLAGGPGTYLSAVLGFYAPISLLAFYLQHCVSPQAGTMLALAYTGITLPDPTGSSAVKFAGQRAGWLVVSVLGCLLYNISLFPILAATDARIRLGNALHSTAAVVRLVEAGKPAEAGAEAPRVQAALTRVRMFSLAEAAGEPYLDRPWDRAVATAICASAQRLVSLASILADYSEHLGGPVPAWTAALVDAAVWKLNTLAMALVTKKALPRLPQLGRAGFGRPSLMLAESGERRVAVAGGAAAFAALLGETDVLEVLVGTIYGREGEAGAAAPPLEQRGLQASAKIGYRKRDDCPPAPCPGGGASAIPPEEGQLSALPGNPCPRPPGNAMAAPSAPVDIPAPAHGAACHHRVASLRAGKAHENATLPGSFPDSAATLAGSPGERSARSPSPASTMMSETDDEGFLPGEAGDAVVGDADATFEEAALEVASGAVDAPGSWVEEPVARPVIPTEAVAVCTCEPRLSPEQRSTHVVPFLFYYSTIQQDRLELPKGVCCFRKPEPCPFHDGAPLPAHAFPPPPRNPDLPAPPSISDLPRELFHMHIFPLLFDCELIALAQASRSFRRLAETEVRRRCERLSLVGTGPTAPAGEGAETEIQVALKRSLARYHRRMEGLRAVQDGDKGPYWTLRVDTTPGFPKIVSSLDYVSLCSIM